MVSHPFLFSSHPFLLVAIITSPGSEKSKHTFEKLRSLIHHFFNFFCYLIIFSRQLSKFKFMMSSKTTVLVLLPLSLILFFSLLNRFLFFSFSSSPFSFFYSSLLCSRLGQGPWRMFVLLLMLLGFE